jgi:hypothetical protein
MSDLEKITELCARLGASPAQAATMAAQLLKRAGQVSVERKITREAAMAQLLQILVEGRQGNVPPAFQAPPPRSE